MSDRTLAPLGRRRLPVVARRTVGAYVVLSVADADGPAPDAGQFFMLAAAERWGGGADERPFLPRAFSVARRHRDGTLDFVLEDVGPGTERLGELGEGDEVWLLGPLGRGFAPPRARRPVLVGGGVGIAPLMIWHDELGPDALVLLGFRDADACRGRRAAAGGAGGDRRRLGRAPRAGDRAAGAGAAPGARSTHADRRRCSRRSGRCAPSTTSPRSSRSSPAWRAASAPASAASSRRGTATSGSASTGRCSTPRGWTASSIRGAPRGLAARAFGRVILLRDRARPTRS